ncbi:MULTISPECIES: nuclear transport factor 2 family protein [unclassified Phenylobacterium]|uniref:nuclear transport factor 2 family protein n=1 Tax=unclassified Phenylobacterium TaxID=2640670 RepID=UPI00083B4539|nr:MULTISPECIES: nuclear transport factor 2 family protein [unclassified Phenylobacterium]
MRAALPSLLLLAFVAGAAQAQTPITETAVRAFVARQQAAWNTDDHDRFFAGFTPEARFTDQAYVGDKPPVPYGTSTLAQARAQALRMRGKAREAVEVTRIEIAPDGRSARVLARVGSRVETDGRVRRLCASRLQTIVLAGGRLRATGKTDTFVKCRGG